MIFSLLCIIISLMAIILYLDVKKPKNYPPGPAWLPIVGCLFQFKKLKKKNGYQHLAWQELHKKYGDVVGTKLGRKYVVVVFGEEAVAQILTREEFEGRPDGFIFRMRTFGRRLGLVFSEGDFWKKQRKFSIQRLKKFGYGGKQMIEKVEEETAYLMEAFLKKSTEPLFMHDAFDISVINVLWTMIAGERFDLEDVKLKQLMGIIHDAFRMLDMSGGVLNQIPLLRYLAPKSSGYREIMEVMQGLWNFLEDTVKDHKCNFSADNPKDLIEAFLQEMTTQNDDSFSDEQLIASCLDLLMAGSETTSNTLSFAVVYMLKYPEVMKKVQLEQDKVVGRNRSPTLQDSVKLPYTNAVLKEVQRIANIPPVGIAHRAVRDAELFGYTIPEDTIVLTSLYSVHMDPKTWQEPHSFRPERFLGDEGKTIGEKSFLPFGYGKRQCLGISLAKANYFLFFTSLLHRFHLEKVPGDLQPDVNGFDGITLSPKPFKVRLIPR
ncbi:methyl farnesoate epoxidase-like [Coccinella septempunctata]|uniref:methyl farnesoate epoxidase-like n=1 Tax=Coccinella septempunctata TaxID=41139 RepID=UPI001D076FE6|nr:methyl farnesoate epoxidase-like [Coccinella septempunctata]